MNPSSSAELTAWLTLNADHGKDKWFKSIDPIFRTPDRMLTLVESTKDAIIYRTTKGPKITMFVDKKDPRFVTIQDSRR